MSAAAEAAPPKAGNKKLIIIIAAVLAVVLLGGGAAVMMMKKSAAAAAAEEMGEDGEATPRKKAAARADPGKPPTFVPLDSFTVNLADRDAERYAQVGITLEIQDAAVDAQIKAFMPVIRNNILLALSDATASELMGREGKAQLARRIQRETSRALGVEIEEEEQAPAEAEAGEAPPRKKRKRSAEPELPITAVHFSNFIIQ